MDGPSPLPAAVEGDPKLCRFVNGHSGCKLASDRFARSRLHNPATARVAMQRNVGAR
jgi:hypothetical protein